MNISTTLNAYKSKSFLGKLPSTFNFLNRLGIFPVPSLVVVVVVVVLTIVHM